MKNKSFYLTTIFSLLLLSSSVSIAQEKAGPSIAAAPNNSADQTKAPLTAKDYTQQIQKFYDSTKDYQATFVQTYTDLAAGASTKSKGKVYIKQPGKMRWDYYKDGKRDKLYVSNGVDFWVYEFGFNQVFKQCLKGSQLKTSLSFLMGSGDLNKEFNIKLHKNSTEKSPKLRLQPKTPTSKYKELEFTLDPATGQVIETVIYDPYGNSNTIQFMKVKLNRSLPDNGFEFTPPKGARLLNPDQKCD